MDTLFHQISPSAFWYDACYVIAFLTMTIVLILEGKNRSLPIIKWLLFLTLLRVSFILGAKVFSVPISELIEGVKTFSIPFTESKMILGGGICFLIAFAIGKKMLKIQHPVIDAFALALPIALAIQRIGCFMAGCCYGVVTDMPWGITYTPRSMSHFHQYQSGLIQVDSLSTLPVHPTQLYESILLIIVACLVFIYGKQLKRNGSAFGLSLILCFVVRFFIECFRHPEAHTTGGEYFGPFNAVQWICLIASIITVIVIYLRERQTKVSQPNIPSTRIVINQLALLLLLLGLIWTFRSWLSITDHLAIAFLIIPASFLTALELYKGNESWMTKGLAIGSLMLPVVVIGQTFPTDTLGKYETFRTLGLGMANGDFENFLNVGTGDGCARQSNTSYFDQKYWLAAGGGSLTKIEANNPHNRVEYSGQVFIGQHKETRRSDALLNQQFLAGAHIAAKQDVRWLGIGVGLHIGNLTYTLENLQREGNRIPTSASRRAPAYPSLYFRLGPRDIFFVDYHLADRFPTSLPGMRQQFGIGTGFGQTNGLSFRMGVLGHPELGYYFSGSIPIEDMLLIEPLILLNTIQSRFDQLPRKQQQFSLGISYRFGHKRANGFFKR
ncbi:MAG: prolipoprotein diacylglyceryl transferase [Cyclobacteriaceae bacterium]